MMDILSIEEITELSYLATTIDPAIMMHSFTTEELAELLQLDMAIVQQSLGLYNVFHGYTFVYEMTLLGFY